VTNHDLLTFSADLAAYARDRGILLIPGVEVTVEGRHVLVYNLDVDPGRIRTFAALRRHRRPEWLVVAPHPFYPAGYCLREWLLREIDVFDAVEFSHFYGTRVDFNRRAVRAAGEARLPLVGTSDAHVPIQLGTTYSVIDSEPTIGAVVAAIKLGRVSVVSRPLTLPQWGRIGMTLLASVHREKLRSGLRRLFRARPAGRRFEESTDEA
jgi:hypothetical protein